LISLTLRLPPTAKLDPGSRSSFVNPAFLRIMRLQPQSFEPFKFCSSRNALKGAHARSR
jgi:hypothetical protein